MPSRCLAGLVIAVVGAGCVAAQEEPGAEGTWVGTITTEGDVTTVTNEAGSVWGGPATLVEETSIGVEAGADEYLLDEGSTVFATDEIIFVVQPSIPVVRRYGFDGTFLGNLGRPGQGPGEYSTPLYVAAVPDRIFVVDGGENRINIYDGEGNSTGTRALTNLACCIWPPALSPGGDLIAPVISWEGAAGPDSPRYGVQVLGDGDPEDQEEVLWVPDFDYQRLTLTVLGGEWEMVPFAPGLEWNPAPVGLIAGASDRYRFEVVRRDGTRTIVERYWESVPVPAQHAEWARTMRLAMIREQVPGWSWSGDEMPSRKPAFDKLIATASGETWVVRAGDSRRADDCPEDPAVDTGLAYWRPCWSSEPIIDAFGADGRYLGEVAVPAGLDPDRQHLFVRDDLVVAVVEDEAGTIRVKRYRLVIPAER